MLKYSILFFLFFVTSFCANSSGGILDNNTSTKRTSSEYLLTDFRAEMLSLVNQLRKEGCRCGRKKMRPVPPVRWNDKLEQAALAHAKDMNKRNFFEHTGSNGSSISDRIEQAGYNWQAVGENIFWGAEVTPSEVFQTWKDSPSHCKNMMDENYDEMGVSQVGSYWVQDFGKQFK